MVEGISRRWSVPNDPLRTDQQVTIAILGREFTLSHSAIKTFSVSVKTFEEEEKEKEKEYGQLDDKRPMTARRVNLLMSN